MATAPNEQRFLVKHRTSFLVAGVLLLLPPLAPILQIATGDTDFCGTWCPRMFLVWRSGMSAQSYFWLVLRTFAGVLLLFAIAVSTLFLGRHWCSHLCPIGGATELGSRIVPRFLRIKLSAVPAPPVRYGYMAVYFLTPLLGLGSLCCSYCNFAVVPRMFGALFLNSADIAYFMRTAGLINLALIVVLGFLAAGGRGYCNFLCPVGALDALVNSLGARFFRRVRVDSSACTGCTECVEVCPVWAIDIKNTAQEDVAMIDQLSCLPCGQCEVACPEGAIGYREETRRESSPQPLRKAS